MCQYYCSYYPFVLWCLVGYCEPLPEMVKGVMLRARDCSAGPIDFTQTWVDGAPRRGRLMLGGHPEMDESHYVCGPTAPSMFIDMISKALFMSSYYALDKKKRNACYIKNDIQACVYYSVHLLYFEVFRLSLSCPQTLSRL